MIETLSDIFFQWIAPVLIVFGLFCGVVLLLILLDCFLEMYARWLVDRN
jgi:hypothetical protein